MSDMQIAVVGAGDCSPEEYEAAQTVGYLIAGNHETLVCGGLSGVMEAACRGAKEAGGTTVGILPGTGGETRTSMSSSGATWAMRETPSSSGRPTR